eukprot:TRINITY_DN12166_c0_g1_i2.p1 TRINITY_DN12166_c0_g1~~TRINITY_DN12166_c0_g1_i2.p1  ORF type:complete len:235 (-),score=24.19 TRINITY_DN12166_c0_g1_i2:101-805(-)
MSFTHSVVWYTVASTFNKPLMVETFIFSSIFLLVAYFVMKALFPITTSKQKAWVITMFGSMFTVVFGFPAVLINVLENSFDLTRLPFTYGSSLDYMVCSFFLAFLFVDLLVGVFQYPDQLDILLSWGHHFGYLILTISLVNHDFPYGLTVMSIMELPTFFLALGHIWKPLRHDLIFGGTFFVTRIVYHSMMIYNFYYYTGSGGMNWMTFLLLVFPLHLHWFGGWISQQRKLHSY